MAYSLIPKTKRDGKIELLDGTGTPVVLEVAFEDGNFTFSQPQQFTELVTIDRGVFSSVRKQDESAITCSFSFNFREFTSADLGSVRDFINQSGAYAGNVSTGTAGTPFVEHYCVDIRYTAEGTDFGDTNDHIVTLGKCVCSLDFSEGDPSNFTLNFTCYGGVIALS